MHHAIGRRVDCKRPAERNRRLNATPNQRVICRLLTICEHAQSNLRPIAVERAAQRPSSRPSNNDDIAGVGLDVTDIRAIHPRMAASEPLFAAGGDEDGGLGQGDRWSSALSWT